MFLCCCAETGKDIEGPDALSKVVDPISESDQKAGEEEPSTLDVCPEEKKEVAAVSAPVAEKTEPPAESTGAVSKATDTDGFVVAFATPSGETKETCFKTKPLGLTFDNKVPLIISEIRPGEQAEALGLQLGWEFKVVAGTDISGKEFHECLALLRKEVDKLPAKS
mmetsp:Transcript_84183/g.146194  ORF Transcript_84183/g.146194 Transcript_84183/m.146194 type:complete len:166 (+) Transcript_84183:130-627(+)